MAVEPVWSLKAEASEELTAKTTLFATGLVVFETTVSTFTTPYSVEVATGMFTLALDEGPSTDEELADIVAMAADGIKNCSLALREQAAEDEEDDL